MTITIDEAGPANGNASNMGRRGKTAETKSCCVFRADYIKFQTTDLNLDARGMKKKKLGSGTKDLKETSASQRSEVGITILALNDFDWL
jgi:hypothetical protein